MKNYFLFLFLSITISINAQNNCDDASYYLVSAYSHVKTSYDSYNITDLKYYANRSLESLKLAKTSFNTCKCDKVIKLVDDNIEVLAKVELAETFEDGRFFVKRGRESCKQSVIDIDQCSNETETDDTPLNENSELSELENEQFKLEKEQEALKQKSEQLKIKLAQQKEKSLKLKKETLILKYKNTIASNIKVYNETLKACDCTNNTELIKGQDPEDLSTYTLENIKKHYLESLKSLVSNYTAQLSSCN